MRFYRVIDGSLKQVTDREQAHEVLMTIEELEALERKIHNKTEEAERWRKRLCGEDMCWKITRRIFNSGQSLPWTLYLSVPMPHSPELFDQVRELCINQFDRLVERGYMLQHTVHAGWILRLHLTSEEYLSFKVPS